MGEKMQSQDARDVSPSKNHHDEDDGIGALELGLILKSRWKVLAFVPLLAGLIAYGAAHLIAPTFTPRPPFSLRSSSKALRLQR